ncbi:hypothetical protein AGMMS50218_05610 [Actinomycetota bacterium]|nr:hypothetical protein AGMMS50218_05610 [Actinomycetota bacterium]
MTAEIEDTTSRRRTANDTKRDVIHAARDLFVTRGFDTVSLRDVASRAGISHPALLKHFRSKEELLALATELLEEDAAARRAPLTGGLDDIVTVAAANASVPGYTQLFSVLAGTATLPDHPMHGHFRQRYQEAHQGIVEVLERAVSTGDIPHLDDVDAEAHRIVAAWDGLQVISLYLPEVDVPGALRRHMTRLRGQQPPTMPIETAPAAAPAPPHDLDAIGYRHGRARRRDILESASALFARAGFHGTSLQEIAELTGVSKSTMLHYFPTKTDLLAAVLSHRDAAIKARTAGSGQGLGGLAAGARSDTTDEPGLISLYAVLSTEAVLPQHPAHPYFAYRYRDAIISIQSLLTAADPAAAGVPAFAALWLVAMWDGLQIQWLYNPGETDIAMQLERHLVALGFPAVT